MTMDECLQKEDRRSIVKALVLQLLKRLISNLDVGLKKVP